LSLRKTGGRPSNRILWADALWTRWAQSRPLALVPLAAAAALAALSGQGALMAVVAAVALAFALYFGLGVLRLGLSRRRLGLLAQAPLVVARLAVIALAGMLRRAPVTWRTSPG
jgi:hypothetical protein